MKTREPANGRPSKPSSLLVLPAHDSEGKILVVVETPRGSPFKVRYEKTLGTFIYKRSLPLGVVYPFDWGFVPSTRADDGDPLDAMVLADAPTWPGVVIPTVPIGIVRVTQHDVGKEKPVRNDRLIAVPLDARYRHFDEVPRETRAELDEFFVVAGRVSGHEVTVECWEGPAEAHKALAATRTAG